MFAAAPSKPKARAWRALAVPLTAALNGVKGQQLTLSLRRGWESPLDQALFANAIDRPVLDAMMQAIDEALPDFRHYLRVKARLLGLPVLAGYDLFAPVGEVTPWPFDTARSFITDQFRAFSPRLGALAERAFAERWIDAGPREGKDGGAFSMPVGDEQSRIFANYLPVYDWMSALAHELGHSYHVVAIVERKRTLLQAPADVAGSPATFPMTLAETASTICEAIVQRAARASATPAQEVSLLDGWLQALSLNVFGTLPRFNFEQQIFAARGARELSAHELDDMMANAWREVAGDAIDPSTVPSTEWAAPHLFIDNIWFYNFPYAFGMLFGLGLLTARDANPEGFFDWFDTLLADSGMREANDLAAEFGIDLRDPALLASEPGHLPCRRRALRGPLPVDRGSERGWFWFGGRRDVRNDRASNGHRKCLEPRSDRTEDQPGSLTRPCLIGRIWEGARGPPLLYRSKNFLWH